MATDMGREINLQTDQSTLGREQRKWCTYDAAELHSTQHMLITSASLLASVSARAVTASCDAKPLLLSLTPCPLPKGVMGMAGTRSRNRGCVLLADLTPFCGSKQSSDQS